jgi:hypothetical protein
MSTPKKPPKPPKNLYLVFRQETRTIAEHDPVTGRDWITVPTDYRLAIVLEYAPSTQTFAKKRKTAFDNIYGSGCTEQPDGIWLKETYSGWGDHRFAEPPIRVAQELQPQVVPNEPQSGYMIQRVIGDNSTDTSKSWRVLDPRGFEIEISISSFQEILINCDIIKGVIQGSFVWHVGRHLRLAE